MNKILFSSASDEWGTPQNVFDYLNAKYNFTLDAAASEENAKCENYFTIQDDALKQKWNGRVFLNPPYSKRNQYHFVEKAIHELNTNPLCEIVVVLIPARTDTQVWHKYLFKHALEIIFIEGRLKFTKQGQTNSNSCATFPSCVVVLGKQKSNTIVKSWKIGEEPKCIS
jgi:site-specific DNA-methyltransferase (adenine-specific)